MLLYFVPQVLGTLDGNAIDVDTRARKKPRHQVRIANMLAHHCDWTCNSCDKSNVVLTLADAPHQTWSCNSTSSRCFWQAPDDKEDVIVLSDADEPVAEVPRAAAAAATPLQSNPPRGKQFRVCIPFV